MRTPEGELPTADEVRGILPLPKPEEWQPDPRTVAAVVEALREADPSDTSTLMLTSGFRYAINVIEERFGSSVSGGEHE